MNPLLRPVLADASTLIGVVFVVITLIGWMINLVNAQAKPQRNARAPRPARPRSERIQSEIEQFMREQSGQKKPQEARPPQVETPRRPAPPPRTPPSRKSARSPLARTPLSRTPISRTPAPPPEPPVAKRLGSSISERSLSGARPLGDSLQRHLQSSMRERVGDEAQRYIGHRVDDEVTRHLGVFSGAFPPPGSTPPPKDQSAEILEILRTPAGVRQALILSEVLKRPLSLRRRS